MPAAATSSGPDVRVAAGDRRRGVDHRADAGLDERLGRDPVEVGVVDDRDLAGREPLDEVLGPAVDPGHGRTTASTSRLDAPGHQRPRAPAARRRSSSLGVARGPLALSGVSRQHPRQLDDPVLGAERRGAGAWCGSALAALASTATWCVGERRHLGQVGDDSTWWSPRQGGQRPADGQRRLAADAGVDLVEHQGAAAPSVSTSRSASIARASSPPDATLASGSARLAGVGGEQEA